jgi:hypothetical protein
MAASDHKLNQLWQQFDTARRQRVFGLALQSLAKLEVEIGRSDLPPALQWKWSRQVAAVTIDDDMRAGIRDWSRDYIERVNLIVSTGGQPDSHDGLYVATALESLQSVQKLLQQKGLAHLIDFDTVDPDCFPHMQW